MQKFGFLKYTTNKYNHALSFSENTAIVGKMQGSGSIKWNTCIIILHIHNLIILIPCRQCFAYVKAPTFVFRDKASKGPTENFQKDRLSCLSFYFHLPSILPSCLCARGKRISLSRCSFPISSGTPRIRVITPPCGTNFISRSYESVVCRALLDYTVCVCCKHVAYLPKRRSLEGTYVL